jgi:hypothetical protein
MKGVFYSLAAVLFITPLIILAMANMAYINSEPGIKTSKIIGDKLASYSKSISNDMPRAIDIMAKRSIGSAVVYVETTGMPLTSSQDVLSELIENGTIYGAGSPTNFTLSSWTSALRAKGMLYGFNTQISVMNIKFYSVDSYTIAVNVVIGLNSTYPAENMGLYRIYNTTIPIVIEGFDDPIYTFGTNGILKREIRLPGANVSGPAGFDLSITQGSYMPSLSGAGFLDRMEGRLVNSGKYNRTEGAAGLESVVYIPDLQANGIIIKPGQSDIDYMYFNSSSQQGSAVNQSSYSWLRIDNDHATTYNLTLV